jgi:hypothetical protein
MLFFSLPYLKGFQIYDAHNGMNTLTQKFMYTPRSFYKLDFLPPDVSQQKVIWYSNNCLHFDGILSDW